MKEHLVGGIPSEIDYSVLLASDGFREMETFSDQFLARNQSILARYSEKWVGDPLHQWSRQWEYPFVFNRLETILADSVKQRVLDAGSGITFFPFYIQHKIKSAEVYCCDSNPSLASIYRAINDGAENGAKFSPADMRMAPYEDHWFDAVYCISVLEHTKDYEEIITDFHRILKPGGTLIVTFDISLDGTRDISPERAVKLLHALHHKFDNLDGPSSDIMTDILSPNIFTTMSAKRIDASLLPWKYPAIFYRVKAMMAAKKFGHWPPLLSAYCLSLTKSRN